MHDKKNRKKTMQPDNRPVKIRRKSKGRIIINILIIIFTGVFLYSGYRIYDILSVYQQNQKLQSEIQKIYYEQSDSLNRVESEVVDGEQEKTELERVNPLRPIQALNEEAVAWIRIDDTVIDYPVLQGADNDFYLNHDIYGEYTVCGSIFMDYRNQIGASLENIILYGHRMNDDSMFGELVKFTKEDFYKNHPSFTLAMVDGTYRCDIFAVYTTTTDFEYYRTSFDDESAFLEYIEACRNESMYESDVEITAGDMVVTLSTCDYSLDVNKGRLVVQAKMTLIEE